MILYDIYYRYTDPYCATHDGLGIGYVLADDENHARQKFRETHAEDHYTIQCIVVGVDDGIDEMEVKA